MTEFVLRTWVAPGEASAIATQDTVINTAVGLIAGRRPQEGNYVKFYTPHGFGGRGKWRFTGDKMQAKRFPTFEAAAEAWKEPSKTHPLRSDGMPNRPLTMFNVTIEKVE
jgi:hypothetical protein